MRKDLSKNSKINLSVLISVLILVVSFLTSFLFTKFLLAQPQIGDVNYGLKVTAGSIVSFVSVFTTGMSSTFIRFHKKYQNDEKSVISTFNFVTLIISVFAIVFGLIMFILAINNKIINTDGGKYTQQQVYEFAAILAISVLYLALSILLSNSKWFLESCKHIVLVRVIDLIVVILYPLISIPCVLAGGNMVVVTIVYSAAYLAGFVFFFVFRINKAKSLSFVKVKVKKEMLKEILIFSLFVVITSAIESFSFSFDKILLTTLITASLTTIYQLGITLHQVMLSVVSLIYAPYAPYIAEEVYNDKTNEIQHTYNKVSLILLLISFLLFTGFAACGKEFITLWVGQGKETVYYFVVILFGIWPLYSAVLFSNAIHRLYGRHYKSSILFIVSFLLHVIITSSLIKVLNIWACIIGLSISYLFLGISFLIYNQKVINLKQNKYLINLLKIGLSSSISIGLTFLIMHFTKSQLANSTVKIFLIEGILSVLFFGICLLAMYFKPICLFVQKTSNKVALMKKENKGLFSDNFITKINNLFPYMVIVYFIFNFASYYLGGIGSFKSFVSTTWFSAFSKGISYLIFASYTVLFAVVNKCEFKLRNALCFMMVFCAEILACIIIPKHISFLIINDYKWTIRIILDVGARELIIESINWLIDLAVLFSYLYLFRQKINKQKLIPFLRFVVIFAILEIGYSFIFQYNEYLYLIGRGSVKNPNLSSTFISKNGFGFLLFQSVIACFYLIKYDPKIKRYISIPIFAFLNIINLCTLCKSSIYTIFIFDLIIFIILLINLKKNKKIYLFYGLIGLAFILILGFSLMFTPAFRTVPVFDKIASKIINIFNFGSKTFQSRINIWLNASKLFIAPYIIFGYGKTIATYFLSACANLNTVTFHNGFLSMLCSYGIIGLALYCFVIYYIIKVTLKTNNKNDRLLLITLIVIVLLYGMVENVYILISSSSVMLVPNVILSVNHNENLVKEETK